MMTMNICFRKSGFSVFLAIPLIIIAALILVAVRGLISLINVIIAVLIISVIMMILATLPRRCKFLSGYVELSTLLCRGRFRVVEVIDERSRLRDYSVVVPIGFRAYPWVYGWGFGGNIPGGVLVFSTGDCNSKWRLVRLADSNGREFYMILCCGS